MSMKKVIPFLLFSTLTLGALAGCSSSASDSSAAASEEDKVLQYQGSPNTVTFPELASSLGYLDDLKLENIGALSGGPESIQITSIGETDFGTAFNGAIIKAVSKGAKIESVVGSYGSDENTYYGVYTLEGSNIKSAKDFIGKKIGVNTLGAHAEFFIKDYLRQGGLTDKEIEQVQLVVVPATNAEQSLRNKQLEAVVLNGISRDLALENGGIQEVFSDVDVFGTEFTAGSYFFTEAYIKENPHTVKKFVNGVAKAIEWARNTPKEEVIEKYTAIVSDREGESTKNLKYFKSTGIAEEGGVIKENEFDIWIDWLEKNGELKDGQVKPTDLFTNEYNDYAKKDSSQND